MYNVDLKKKFQDYLHDLEGYSFRIERFDAECDADIMNKERILEWMEAAFFAGANAMAQDTLDTLGDYGTSLAGINEVCYTRTQAFDIAADNLKMYYDIVLKDKQ
jgi:hypothetical protein